MSDAISDKDKKTMKRGLYAFVFIVVFGSIGAILTKYSDTLPKPPRSHEIQMTVPSNDVDRITAVLMRADFNQIASKEKLSVSQMAFYSSDANPDEAREFYVHALSTPWNVAADRDVKGQRVIIYRKMITGEMKIILIGKRFTRNADNHVSDGPGSIIGIAEVGS